MEDSRFEQLDSVRLRISRFRDDDAEALASYRNDAAVARFQGWSLPYAVADAKLFITKQRSLHPGRPGTWFQFALRRRPSAALIGDVALRTTDQHPPEGELGFSLASPHQGYGYAAEAVARVINYAFGELEMSRLFAITDAQNQRARLLFNRLGFALTHELENGACVYDRLRSSTHVV